MKKLNGIRVYLNLMLLKPTLTAQEGSLTHSQHSNKKIRQKMGCLNLNYKTYKLNNKFRWEALAQFIKAPIMVSK